MLAIDDFFIEPQFGRKTLIEINLYLTFYNKFTISSYKIIALIAHTIISVYCHRNT